MEQAGKNTILLVRGTAAEPVGLSAFAAAQPDVQLQTVSGLDEAHAALARSRPTLIIMQSDAPGAQELRRCAELAESAEAFPNCIQKCRRRWRLTSCAVDYTAYSIIILCRTQRKSRCRVVINGRFPAFASRR